MLKSNSMLCPETNCMQPICQWLIASIAVKLLVYAPPFMRLKLSALKMCADCMCSTRHANLWILRQCYEATSAKAFSLHFRADKYWCVGAKASYVSYFCINLMCYCRNVCETLEQVTCNPWMSWTRPRNVESSQNHPSCWALEKKTTRL